MHAIAIAFSPPRRRRSRLIGSLSPPLADFAGHFATMPLHYCSFSSLSLSFDYATHIFFDSRRQFQLLQLPPPSDAASFRHAADYSAGQIASQISRWPLR